MSPEKTSVETSLSDRSSLLEEVSHEKDSRVEILNASEISDLGLLALRTYELTNLIDEKNTNQEKVDQNTQVFSEILKIDEEVKQMMADLSVTSSSEFNLLYEHEQIDYLWDGNDSLKKKFEEIFYRVDRMHSSIRPTLDDNGEIKIHSDSVTDNLRDKLKDIHQNFENAISRSGNSLSRMQAAYRLNVSDMNSDWARRVAEKMFGFSILKNEDVKKLTSEVKTYNELLHLTHSYVMSSEDLRDVIVPWSEKIEGENHYIRGLGKKTEISDDIYKSFLEAWRLGQEYEEQGWRHQPSDIVDVLSLDNFLQIVVRDYGHALNLSIDNLAPDNEGKLLVRYSMPKITNVEMVNQLPGLNEVRGDYYARGEFTINASRAGEEIIDFVKKVPTDEDLD